MQSILGNVGHFSQAVRLSLFHSKVLLLHVLAHIWACMLFVLQLAPYVSYGADGRSSFNA